MYLKEISLKSLIPLMLLTLILTAGCSTGPEMKKLQPQALNSNSGAGGHEFEISFRAGEGHNHPTFAFWLESMDEKYLETLFVTRSVATGYFGHGDLGDGRWSPDSGAAYRPATLPYWLHKRIPAGEAFVMPGSDSPVLDAVTGATPKYDFDLRARSSGSYTGPFRLLLEINQTWDWNQHWHNNRYPEDPLYKSSAQPAVLYAVTIDPGLPGREYVLNPIGHSHWSGGSGEIFTDLSTLTTALQIAERVQVRLVK